MHSLKLLRKPFSALPKPLSPKSFRVSLQTQTDDEHQNTPKTIKQYLDDHVIGQDWAKKILAIAYRNRYRRKRLAPEKQREVTPKNILMIGNTGSGKSELARRLANFTKAPFIKVEATHYTEVGYYGKDVESIITDLLKVTEKKTKASLVDTVEKLRPEIESFVNLVILDILLGSDFDNIDVRKEKLEYLENVI